MEEDKRYYEEDEIDLYELWVTIKKRGKLIVALFLFATFLTAAVSFIMTPVYKSHLFVGVPLIAPNEAKMPLIAPNEAKMLIESITTFLKEKDYDQLKKLLGLKEDTLQKLKEINCKIERGNKQSFTLEIETTQKEDIPKISSALISYLNKNQYVKEKIQIERNTLKKKKAMLLSKLKEMEKLKNNILKRISSGQTSVIGFNPMEVETSIVSVRNELQNTEKALTLLKGFEKINEPFIPKKPFKPKKTLMIAVAGITALFLGIFLAFFLEWLNKAREESVSTNLSNPSYKS